MTEVKARYHNVRMSPRKVRLVANLITGMDVSDAVDELQARVRRASLPLLKLLRSALSNAANLGIGEEGLRIKEVRVDEGRALRRFRKQAPGRMKRVTKRSSHIELVLVSAKPLQRRPKPSESRQPQETSEDARASEVVGMKEGERAEETKPRVPSPFSQRPKTMLRKGRDFVQRVFRRKAI